MKRKITFFLISIFVLTLTVSQVFFCCDATVKASEKAIKVGIIEYPDYSFKDKNGIWRGIDVEYIDYIAQEAGIKVEFVGGKSVDELKQKLDDGSIDVLADVSDYNEDFKGNYLFSESELGSFTSGLIVNEDDDRYEYGDYAKLSGKKVAVNINSSEYDLFKSWCEAHDLSVQYLECDGLQASLKLLKNKEVDATEVATSSLNGYRSIQNIGSAPYYLAFRKDETALKNKLDISMGQIITDDPTYLQGLIKRYLSNKSTSKVVFTDKEKKYLQSHGNIRIAVVKDDEPFFYKDENGNNKGVLPDFYKLITKKTGIVFEFVQFKTQNDAEKAVLNGKADALGMYSSGLIAANSKGLRTTANYSVSSTVLLKYNNTKTSDIKKIAVKTRTKDFVKNNLPSEYSDVKLVGCSSANECFEKLKAGSVDAMISGLPSASWIMSQNNSANFTVSPITSLSMEMHSAVKYNQMVLCGIMDKGINALSYKFDSLIANNTVQGTTWRSFIAKLPTGVIAVFGIVMVVLVVFLITAIILIIKRQKEKSQIEKEKNENEKNKAKLEAMAKSTEAKNQFFSTISHDMRTPLNAILGFTTLLKKENISPKSEEYVDKIQTSGELLNNLINDTLMMSKINSGKLSLYLQPIELFDLIDSIVVPIQEVSSVKKIDFRLDISQTHDRFVLVDKINTQKIFLNLLSNAVKYTPAGGHVLFSVRDDEKDPDGNTLDFVVQDDGIGISEQFIPHLYEPFMQEHSNSDISGTGLGLSIVKQLIGLMDGNIIVESEKNKGTKFTVKLVLKETEAVVGNQRKSEKVSVTDIRGRTILVCEDNSLNMEITKALLENKGVKVIEAVNGEKGLEVFESSEIDSIDAILMDIRMPKMNGYQAAKAIRALERKDAATVVILALSADAYEDDVKKSILAGMNGHIAKPINPEKLYEELYKYLG